MEQILPQLRVCIHSNPVNINMCSSCNLRLKVLFFSCIEQNIRLKLFLSFVACVVENVSIYDGVRYMHSRVIFFNNASDLFSQLRECFVVVKPLQVIVNYFTNLLSKL